MIDPRALDIGAVALLNGRSLMTAKGLAFCYIKDLLEMGLEMRGDAASIFLDATASDFIRPSWMAKLTEDQQFILFDHRDQRVRLAAIGAYAKMKGKV